MFNFSTLFQRKTLGKWGEEYIGNLYARKGYRILDRNYFNRYGKRLGEIDLVALKDKELVFIEVKTRASDTYGSGLESVNGWKQRRLVKACKLFVCSHPQFTDYNYRIDVAELSCDLDRNPRSVRIIENAVEDVQ